MWSVPLAIKKEYGRKREKRQNPLLLLLPLMRPPKPSKPAKDVYKKKMPRRATQKTCPTKQEKPFVYYCINSQFSNTRIYIKSTTFHVRTIFLFGWANCLGCTVHCAVQERVESIENFSEWVPCLLFSLSSSSFSNLHRKRHRCLS